jgi:predicted glycosyltransferase
VDIENPPQVRYLLPIVRRLRERDAHVVVTARDYGITLELLKREGVDFRPLGAHFGASKVSKVAGNLRRTIQLRRLMRRADRTAAVISCSRSASLAARSLAVPSFVICDYEFVNLAAFRVARSYVLHPDVIPAAAFTSRGVDSRRLLPFVGIKEGISFAGVDPSRIPPARIPEADTHPGVTRVLVRPPAEESHYHRTESTSFADEMLRCLARRDDCLTLFLPRYDHQVGKLARHEWKRAPVVLDRPIDFVELYNTVDVVVSGGGTMTREAAYVGVPAISIFQGKIGAVDRYLASLGRLTLLSEPSELDSVDLHTPRQPPLAEHTDVVDGIVDCLLSIAAPESGQLPSAG